MVKNNPVKIALSLKQKTIILACGIIFVVVILELGIRLFGGIFLFLQEYRNRVSIAQKGGYRIMCVGESTTAMGGDDSYPSQLEEVLNARKIGVKFSVINKGVVMVDTSFILSNLESNLNQCQPKMVIAMMGCNDKDVAYYEDISDAKTPLFKELRVYRLIKTLWMHVVNKTKKTGMDAAEQNRNHHKQVGLLKNKLSSIKAIKIKPGKENIYINLGKHYWKQNMFIQAEKAYRKAIELNPRAEKAYEGLGLIYSEQEKLNQSEASFQKAIELEPSNVGAYSGLGQVYKKEKKFSEAEEVFNKAIEVNPNIPMLYFMLGNVYLCRDKFTQSERVLKKAVEIAPEHGRAYGSLARLYAEMGKDDLAREYYKKAQEVLFKKSNLVTSKNFRNLKKILDQRGIKLVCVQYPTRSIEPLKKIFEGYEGVIFVNNEKIFKDAVRRESYEEYFIDDFAGDFGHCTAKGNRLLAENIANVILKEVFGPIRKSPGFNLGISEPPVKVGSSL